MMATNDERFAHSAYLRARGTASEGKVAFAELFFDLIFVLTIIQLSHSLAAHYSPLGLVEAALLMLATVWAIRSSGLHHVVNEHAFRTRNDWAALPLEWRREGRWPSDPGQLRVIEALRQDALDSPTPNPNQMPEWRQRWYGE